MLLDKIVSEQCEYTGMILNIRTEVKIKKLVGRSGIRLIDMVNFASEMLWLFRNRQREHLLFHIL